MLTVEDVRPATAQKGSPSLPPARPIPARSLAWYETLDRPCRPRSGQRECRARPPEDIDPLVGPKRTYPYYAIVYLADADQVLLSYVSGLFAVLAISCFVYEQRAALSRGSLRIFEQ